MRNSRAICVSTMRISHVVKGTRPVTAELALLFGRALRQTPQYWLNLQAAYDLKAAEAAISDRLEAVMELVQAWLDADQHDGRQAHGSMSVDDSRIWCYNSPKHRSTAARLRLRRGLATQ